MGTGKFNTGVGGGGELYNGLASPSDTPRSDFLFIFKWLLLYTKKLETSR